MTTAKLSQIGLALIILEGQIEQELQNERKWARREAEARENKEKAREVKNRLLNSVQNIKEQLF